MEQANEEAHDRERWTGVTDEDDPSLYWQLLLDHPIRPISRWGHGKPANANLMRVIESGRAAYARTLQACLNYQTSFATIARDYESDSVPYWSSGWMSPLDLMVLYSTVAEAAPRTYLEIGSGTSTAFVRHAINHHGLPSRIVSIDPDPRADIDRLCDQVIRTTLEDADLSIFDGLQAGDVVLLDGSHRSFTNSDVTVAFLDVVPRLPEGVILGIDDIYLPYDYPPEWLSRFYNEQYVLAAWLLGGSRRMQLRGANYFASQDAELRRIVQPLWNDPRLEGLPTDANGFWVTIGR
jgi:hypothetical protein